MGGERRGSEVNLEERRERCHERRKEAGSTGGRREQKQLWAAVPRPTSVSIRAIRRGSA